MKEETAEVVDDQPAHSDNQIIVSESPSMLRDRLPTAASYNLLQVNENDVPELQEQDLDQEVAETEEEAETEDE